MLGANRIQLKLEYWFISHKREFRRWWNLLFVTFDALLLLFVLVTGIIYLVQTPRAFRETEVLAFDAVDYTVLSANAAPLPVTATHVQTVASGPGRVDALAQVRNANTEWVVQSITYQFTVGGVLTDVGHSYLLPNQEKYLTQFSVPVDEGTGPPSASFAIVDIEYKRVDPSVTAPSVQVEFVQTSFDEPTLTTGSLGMRVRSVAVNQSIVGFRAATVTCVLFDEQQVVAVASVPVGELRRGTEVPFACTWIVNLPVTNVVLQAETPVFDEQNIIPFEPTPVLDPAANGQDAASGT